jgi:hypothetical protein
MRALRLALVLALGACSPAYYEEQPMETEVVLVQQAQEQPTVVVGDPNDPFAVPQQQTQPQVVQVQPQVVQPQPQIVQVQPQVMPVHQQGPRIVSGPQPRAAGSCTNTCRYANDRECDDGRPGAHTALCTAGTDCNDCGPAMPQTVVTPAGQCFNTCRYANDGECDDGRSGSHTALCQYGSDCNDCGPG